VGGASLRGSRPFLQGDYNGDGKTDPAVLRLLDTYEWVARGLFDVRFGRFGDVPLAPLPLRCANYRQCFI